MLQYGDVASNLWATYRQWQDLGAQVRKGEHSTLVVFWKFFDGEREDDLSDEGEERAGKSTRAILARGYPVFNAGQVDGYQAPPIPTLSPAERIERAERFFAELQADIRHGGGRAYYNPEADYIQMPRFEVFRDGVSYYSVRSHETIHWTGAPHRTGRELKGRFGSEAYAAEELVAELGAAFICAQLGLSTEPRPDHAAYVASWLQVLKNDKRAIFTAASKAQTAADWLNSQQREKRAAA